MTFEENGIVTTSYRCTQSDEEIALLASERTGMQYVRRGSMSYENLMKEYDVDVILVAKKQQLILETMSGEFFFHPNMSHIRIKNLKRGMKDHMAEAMDLKEGSKVLDCTLGLGADAIVESYIAGSTGSVTALEHSAAIEAVVSYGLSHYPAKSKSTLEAMRRIKVIHVDYMDYMRHQSDKAFDVVYFDPMFRYPLMKSTQLAPLRVTADHAPVSIEAVREAMRIGRRVVLKENARSLEFERLGFSNFIGGKYSNIRFGFESSL